MFNFLFDGKLGDILAPVVPSNQLYLAIQHFKNDQIPGLLNTVGYDPNKIESGYGAIHVACRYNNRYALDLLLAKGTSIQLLDQSGNTPLHYAAKYGHLDLCKYLIENGCSAAQRNKQQQTCYDIAEAHIVRQYLLPIVLQAERNADPSSFSVPAIHQPAIHQPALPQYPIAPSLQQQQAYVPPPAQPAAPVPPPPAPTHYPSYPTMPFSSNNTSLPSLVTQPGAQNSGSVPVNVPMQTYNPYTPVNKPAASTTGTTRIIQPDGFHSSASDPVLQQKYGHIIEKPSIAPPPTGPPTQFSGYSTGSSTATPSYSPAPGYAYNRYVAYDATTNTAAPLAAPSNYYQQPAQPYSVPNPTHAPIPMPGVVNPNVTQPSSAPNAPLPHPHQQTLRESSPPLNTVGTPTGQNTTVNRLLGNKAFSPDLADVVTANSNSSSIL